MKAIAKKVKEPAMLAALAVNNLAAVLLKAPAPREVVKFAAKHWIDRHDAVNHVPHMIATMNALNSPRSGHPIPVILTEKVPGEAWGFLQSCREITDKDLLENLDENNQNTFFSDYPLEYKTIVVRNLDRLKKGKDGLMKLLHDGLNGGKTNFVAITTNAKEELLRSPYILKMCLPPAPINPAAFSSSWADEGYTADIMVGDGMLQFLFSLIKPQPVEIPYTEQLAASLGQGFSPSRGAFKILINFIINVTLRHNAQPKGIDQLISEKLFNVDSNTWLKSSYSGTTQSCPAPSAPIKASKFDYFHVWIMRDVILNLADASLNSYRQRVFEAVKKRNLEWIEGNCLDIDKPKAAKQAINLNEAAWAGIDDIMENVNDGSVEKLDEATVINEIAMLIKEGVVQSKTHTTFRYPVYSVTTLAISDLSHLPHPREINDGINTAPIQVFNPITGEEETI